MEQADKVTQLPLVLQNLDETPVTFANHFIIQFTPDAFVLTIGQITFRLFFSAKRRNVQNS
jgi:hypothetical protein